MSALVPIDQEFIQNVLDYSRAAVGKGVSESTALSEGIGYAVSKFQTYLPFQKPKDLSECFEIRDRCLSHMYNQTKKESKQR